MRKFFTILSITSMIFVMSECKSTKTATDTTSKPKEEFYEPTEVNAVIHEYSLTDLKNGRAIFLSNCGKCHRLYQPSKHDLTGWKETVTRMQPKAHLSDIDRELVIKYLSSEK